MSSPSVAPASTKNPFFIRFLKISLSKETGCPNWPWSLTQREEKLWGTFSGGGFSKYWLWRTSKRKKSWINDDYHFCVGDYSAGQKKRYEYCFMKQKCQIQIGIAQYKNIAIILSTWGINITHQHFQMRYITLF